MAIFSSYVKLPEGMTVYLHPIHHPRLTQIDPNVSTTQWLDPMFSDRRAAPRRAVLPWLPWLRCQAQAHKRSQAAATWDTSEMSKSEVKHYVNTIMWEKTVIN